MLSSTDLERLITDKRRVIEVEKSALGLSPPSAVAVHIENIENGSAKPEDVRVQPKKRIRFLDERQKADEVDIFCKQDRRKDEQTNTEDEISAGLERYIRRYLGLPVMLKAGEFSPNNPILREERTSGDALLGLGEYERRRNTLRKIRQQQYREYLDQQAKKKQEEKEKAEKLRRELDEKERLKEEERDRIRQELEKDKHSPVHRRPSVCYVDENAKIKANSVGRSITETGIQVNVTNPLSVAVQTDHVDLYTLSSPQKRLTTAERELSPRTVGDKLEYGDHRDDRRADCDQNRDHWNTDEISNKNSIVRGKRDHWDDRRPGCDQNRDHWHTNEAPPKSTIAGGQRDHWDDRRPGCDQNRDHWNTSDIPAKNTIVGGKRDQWDDQRPGWDQNRDHWHKNEHFNDLPARHSGSNPRHNYMPSILDSDVIRMRNLQVEKEAAERRQFYQQELKHQIEEQHRIREERKTREKMLEQAEMRRLEEQLRMLRMAQEREVVRHHDITHRMRDGASDFETRRNGLKREIEHEQQKLRAKTQHVIKRSIGIPTSRSDNSISKLPFYYPKDEYHNEPAYSTNIPENSIFSPNYDVDSYLRKNLNPSKDVLLSNRLDTRSTEGSYHYGVELIGGSMNSRIANNNVEAKTNEIEPKNGGSKYHSKVYESGDGIGVDLKLDSADCDRRTVVEKAQIHHRPKEKQKPLYEPSFLKNVDIDRRDETPIPVLRHSPKVQTISTIANEDLSENARLLDDKWKVPVVQKNILRTLPSEEGKTVSILTQLGSIRRQLQLEQMRLDNLKGNSK